MRCVPQVACLVIIMRTHYVMSVMICAVNNVSKQHRFNKTNSAQCARASGSNKRWIVASTRVTLMMEPDDRVLLVLRLLLYVITYAHYDYFISIAF